MTELVIVADPRFADHQPGVGHPERPGRLLAVAEGFEKAGVSDALVFVAPRPATDYELARVHDLRLVSALERLAVSGGRAVDADTSLSLDSMIAARLAAGAGLEAVARLDRGEADTGFCAVRPPGHHATSRRAMGFCLLNNVSVTAAELAARGERVAIVDFDAHHGNGTEEIFWRDPTVLYISLHQWPLYPGTGAVTDQGTGDGLGATLNVPLPAGTCGNVYRRAVEELIAPAMAAHGATWLLISAGYDGHRADPLAGLGLTAIDFAELTGDLLQLVAPGRRLLFLEGGYDLASLRDSVAATLSSIVNGKIDRSTYGDASIADVGCGALDEAIATRRRLFDLP